MESENILRERRGFGKDEENIKRDEQSSSPSSSSSYRRRTTQEVRATSDESDADTLIEGEK